MDEASDKKVMRDPVAEALDLISQGEVDRALVLLAGEAEKSPEDSRVFFLLGQISADRHHLSEASHWLSRTLALDPLHLWAHYSLGLVWVEEGKRDAALQAFKKAIYIDPNFALGYFYLGKIYRDRGQIEKACKSLAVAKRLLSSAPLSDTLQGTNGITAQQLLSLVDRELNHEG
ncbi:MAG: tetratricopeptide repeat protein [Deltaproteobacteria bacterium]|nr:MAG: tetratricopeptide repeat protein [Deltaproteobacteria bacterium]